MITTDPLHGTMKLEPSDEVLNELYRLRAEIEKLRAYLGPNAVTYRVPGVTVIKIYDHAQSAAEAVRFGHETSYVSAALKETGD